MDTRNLSFYETLSGQITEEWRSYYLEYEQLKDMISILSAQSSLKSQFDQMDSKGGTSLTVPLPTNAAGMPVNSEDSGLSMESFYVFLESQMKKIEEFTEEKINEQRRKILEIERKAKGGPVSMVQRSITQPSPAVSKSQLRVEVDEIAEEFLKLEKFVNLNFTGFHKILVKHDKHFATNPCKAFYTARLHEQSWVRGDYSDVLTSISRVYNELIDTPPSVESPQSATDPSSNTSSVIFWVESKNLSTVKLAILQNLPVQLQPCDTLTGELALEKDYTLVNNVYLDNRSMELYHSKLQRLHGASSLRLQWASDSGGSVPNKVSLDRLSHVESWHGPSHVKESITLKESKIISVLHPPKASNNGSFSMSSALFGSPSSTPERKSHNRTPKYSSDVTVDVPMEGAGSSSKRELLNQICQEISHKQLTPTIRVQYMRTAYQIPFDAGLRVTLDTNVVMVAEWTKETLSGERWCRSTDDAIPPYEMTKFPHTVMEVRVPYTPGRGLVMPNWVIELLQQGVIKQVDKFSKFLHGCSILFPDDIRCLPYWVDDPSLAESVISSGAGGLLQQNRKPLRSSSVSNSHDPNAAVGDIVCSNERHMFSDAGPSFESRSFLRSMKPRSDSLNPQNPPLAVGRGNSTVGTGGYGAIGGNGTIPEHEAEESCISTDFCFGGGTQWDQLCGCICCREEYENDQDLDDANTIEKIEPKLLFANERTFIKWIHMSVIISSVSSGVLAFSVKEGNAQYIALTLLPISLLFVVYALWTYLWRTDMIRNRLPGERWDDPVGPVLLIGTLLMALVGQFILKRCGIIE